MFDDNQKRVIRQHLARIGKGGKIARFHNDGTVTVGSKRYGIIDTVSLALDDRWVAVGPSFEYAGETIHLVDMVRSGALSYA